MLILSASLPRLVLEINSEMTDGPHSVVFAQETNDVAVNMAILYLLLGESRSDNVD